MLRNSAQRGGRTLYRRTRESKSFHISDSAFKNSVFCILSLSSKWSRKRRARNLVSSRKKEEPVKAIALGRDTASIDSILCKSTIKSAGILEKASLVKYVREFMYILTLL
uniref:Uncharacterized protein n=1 Tax=Arundo donax TaxID=35708 RepID=A0A0A9FV07_ARUDO